jgi:uncharacterized membrane protein
MQSRLTVQGRPIQPVLVAFPLGLFACATLCDLTAVAGGPAFLRMVGYWTIVVGLVAAALTFVAGMIDLWDVVADGTRRAAVTFNLVSGAATILFLVVCLVRAGGPERGATGGLVAIEILGLAVGAAAVRLGADLVRQFDQPGGAAGIHASRPAPGPLMRQLPPASHG